MTACSQDQGLQGWGERGRILAKEPPHWDKSQEWGPKVSLGNPMRARPGKSTGSVQSPCNAPRVGWEVARRVRGHRATVRGPRPESWAKAKEAQDWAIRVVGGPLDQEAGALLTCWVARGSLHPSAGLTPPHTGRRGR